MSDTPETPAPSGAPEAPLQPGSGSTPPGSNKTKVWLAIGAIVVVGLAGFFGARALSGNSKKAGASNTLPPTSASGGSSTGNSNGGGRGFGNFANRGTTGKITALASPNFTVQSVTITGGGPESGTRPSTSNGPLVTVKTSGSTRYTVTKTVALSAIAKGDRVIATGTQGSNGITATSITDMGTATANGGNGFGGGGRGGNGNGSTPGGGGFGGGAAGGGGSGFGGGAAGGAAGANGRSFAFGTVQSVSGNSIVLTTANGTSTVTVGSSATISKTESGSFSDLKVGDTVVVTGTKTGNTVTATDVRTGTGNGAGGFGFGGGFGRGRFGGGAAGGQAGA